MLEVVFAITLIAAMLSNFAGIPGNIIIAVNSLIYGLVTNFNHYSLTFVLTVFLIVIAVEFLEYLLIVIAARKYGASRWGIIGSIIGGLGGAISGAFFTPVIGAIIGSIIGVFIGALVGEFFKSFDLRKSLMSGIGAFIGKLGGLSVKTCGAITLVIMIAYKIL